MKNKKWFVVVAKSQEDVDNGLYDSCSVKTRIQAINRARDVVQHDGVVAYALKYSKSVFCARKQSMSS